MSSKQTFPRIVTSPSDRWGFVFVWATLFFVLYGATLPRGLSWDLGGADGGEIAAAVIDNGLIHSPGYPTYLITAQLSRLIPLSPFALRLNLFSALFAALSVGTVAYTASQLLKKTALRWAPIAASALLWGLHRQVWSQAVIIEVYTLAGFYCGLLMLLTWRQANAPREALWVVWGLVFGLGMGAHFTIALVALFGIYQLLAKGTWRGMLWAALGIAIGLLVFFWLPLQAGNSLHSNWGNPNTWADFWWVVRGDAYSGRLNLLVSPMRIISLIGLIVRQLSIVGVILVVFGFLAWLETRVDWAIVGIGVVALNIWLVAAYNSADILPFLFPSILIFALAGGVGLQTISEHLTTLESAYPHIKRLASLGILLLLGSTLLWQNLSHIRSASIVAEQFGRTVIEDAPINSVILSTTEEHTFSIRYAAAAEKRHDLVLIDLDLLYFDWYQQDVLQQLGFPADQPLAAYAVHPLESILPFISPNAHVRTVVTPLPVSAEIQPRADGISFLVSFSPNQ